MKVRLIDLVSCVVFVVWGSKTDTTGDISVLFVLIIVLKNAGLKMSDMLVKLTKATEPGTE